MADLIIKPASSSDSIKFQGSDSSAKITITGTAGTLESGIAVSAAGVTGTLGSSVTIPAAGVTGTLGSGVVIPAAGVTGTLGSGVTLDSGITGIPAAGITGTLGSSIVFPVGHTIKIYGPAFHTTSGEVTKTTQAYGEIHSDFRVTVNNMLSSSNYLMFHYQAQFGARTSGNSWANFLVGESADYTTIYSGITSFPGNSVGERVEMGNSGGTVDRYDINTFHMFSTGHSGSKTFSPLYKSEQGNSVRGCGGAPVIQFFQIYEIQA